MEAGDELVVVGDSEPAEHSIRRACQTHGFAVEAGPPTEEGRFSLRIRVTELSTLPGE